MTHDAGSRLDGATTVDSPLNHSLSQQASLKQQMSGIRGDSFGHGLAMSADGKTLAIGAGNTNALVPVQVFNP